MFKRILPLIMSLSLLVGCGSTTSTTTATSTSTSTSTSGETTQILASSYPVYILASALTAGLEDISISRLNTGDISCLHDYTLTVADMKLIEGADLIALNGGDLEEFMADALAQTSATLVYCDTDMNFLYMDEHDHDHDHDDEDDHDHDHEEEEHVHTEDCDHSDEDDHDHDHDDEEEHVHTEDCDHSDEDDHDHDHDDEEQVVDPHFWLDPALYAQMASTLSTQLTQLMPQHEDAIAANLEVVTDALVAVDTRALADISSNDFITFHDGFQYFSEAFGMNLLAAIEEEAGSEASAQDIAEIIALVNEHNIPAIFAEENGSDASAQAIARETNCEVYVLSMMMSGDDIADDLSAQDILSTYYLAPLDANLNTIKEAMN